MQSRGMHRASKLEQEEAPERKGLGGLPAASRLSQGWGKDTESLVRWAPASEIRVSEWSLLSVLEMTWTSGVFSLLELFHYAAFENK